MRILLAAVGLFALAPGARGQTLLALGESILVDHADALQGARYMGPHADDVWIHVSVSTRKLSLYRGSERLYDFPVGVGTGGKLRRLDGGIWEWDTPTGIFEVGRKRKDPVWYAPDWHYLEKGLRPPPADSPERYLHGVLGDYALYIDDEIAIHGTRDRGSVGRASSHGCLRMFNEDISRVFDLVSVGTKVIITP